MGIMEVSGVRIGEKIVEFQFEILFERRRDGEMSKEICEEW